MTMTAASLAQRYFRDPDAFWQGNSRQSHKSSRRFAGFCRQFGWSRGESLRLALTVAAERIASGVPTLYLPSFGASGSHLIQHALGLALPCLELGEIYMPAALVRRLAELPLSEAQLFMEVYGLLHATNPVRAFDRALMVNTAHNPTLASFSRFTATYRAVLLVRDPVDIVLSRTFRKDEYRAYLHPEAVADEVYLEDNILKTSTFFDKALKHGFDSMIFFEDIAAAPSRLCATLASVVGDAGLAPVLEEKLLLAMASGDSTNKYNGPASRIGDDVRAHVRMMLDPVIAELDALSARVPGYRGNVRSGVVAS